jgi:hypothetical protein
LEKINFRCKSAPQSNIELHKNFRHTRFIPAFRSKLLTIPLPLSEGD